MGENIEKKFSLKVFKIYEKKEFHKKNDTNAKHPQIFTYKMTVVSAEEAKSGGRTKK